jgi:hypothetical protein
LTDTGERFDLKAGDIASFDKGTHSVWTFTESFKKFTRDLGLSGASRVMPEVPARDSTEVWQRWQQRGTCRALRRGGTLTGQE